MHTILPSLAPQINIVIPLYNEQAVFSALIDRLRKVMAENDLSIEVILIDDGSRDQTPLLMQEVAYQDERFQCIYLSRNFGHQIALSAGLSYVNATEGIFILDGDLQDPPELLAEFYAYLSQGYDVVYAVRKKRKESLFKRLAYKVFYKTLKRISYIEIPLDSGDFSLVSRRVIDHLNAMPENSRFLRGMRSWVGYKQIGVEYERHQRQEGDSKYSLKQLIALAFNGIFNFSEYPIKFILNLGATVMTVSLGYFGFTLAKKVFWGDTPEGFTALLFVIILFGGIQLIALGLIGEYVLRIFFQVKGRPLFIVKERIYKKERTNG
ncbi:MAG: glycosyltransferase family 2 protein [Bacteroidota bacterium]